MTEVDVDEFEGIRLCLKEFSEVFIGVANLARTKYIIADLDYCLLIFSLPPQGKFKLLEDIRAIQIESKTVQERSFRLRKELQEGRTRYQDFISHCDRLRTRLLELSSYQRT